MSLSLEEKVKIIRKITELTQEQTAKQLNVSRSTVANWECKISLIQRKTRPRVEEWVNKKLKEIAKKDLEEGTFYAQLISSLGLTETEDTM